MTEERPQTDETGSPTPMPWPTEVPDPSEVLPVGDASEPERLESDDEADEKS
jgi:hypothetical protein